ncbi:transglycosylase SLT domain-containing protein [Dokdonella sp.]|uniref:transglycosylase SLT domain-containing protein n=1 Tax=Dokdonella sp. TaxID=2291710 RepID=UPI0031C9454A|nr:transglycosylase SLT domain-containing protein [Dokdonella sp.]
MTLRGVTLALLLALLALPASAADRADLRVQFREALAQARRPPEGAWKRLAASLEEAGYPLVPYIELAALREHPTRLERREVERFLARWPDTLAARDLREAWLRELARREDWTTFRAFWQPTADRTLQCDELRARLAGGGKLDYAADIEPLWQGASPLPAPCDPVLRAARGAGLLDDARIEARIARAAEAGRAGTAADAARLLDGSRRSDAERIVAALRDPANTLDKARKWPDDDAHREAVAWAIARYARRNSAAAETAWAGLEARFKWDAAQKNRVLHALALYRSTSYSDDAMARLDALPEAAEDDATREWRVRVALASGDHAATLAALDRLSAQQQRDERWRYLRARILDKLGRSEAARALFAEVATQANFHGFLAADWIGAPYALCPRKLPIDADADAALQRQADLARAFEFRALGMLADARREWNFAMDKLDPLQRRRAADLASRQGWYDRAIFAFSAQPETYTLYERRFPLGMEKQVRSDARTAGIDPAWAYAIIRAESAWMSDARSSADAYGLMQLLPAVGKQMAKAEGLAWSGAQSLFDARFNVRLGTRYLGLMADRFDGSPWLASAAYNAGAGAVARWLAARGTLEPDFFIETIPYRETREYVARVLAFSVIYDWRLNGKVLPLSVRMPRIGQAYQPPADADARKPVACPAATDQATALTP